MWKGCRDECWLLDRHQVCMWVWSIDPEPADELTERVEIVTDWG